MSIRPLPLNRRAAFGRAVAPWALSAMVAFAPLGATQAAEPVKVQAGPSEAVRAWARAVESGDAAALKRMHGPATLLYGTDSMSTLGGADIVAGYEGMFQKFRVAVAVRDTHFVRSGSLLASWGLFTLTLTPRAGGEPIVVNGRFSDLAEQVDGSWRYIVDHASLPAKP